MTAPQGGDSPVTWRQREDFADAFPGDGLGELLTVSASMTGALRRRCAGAFRLRVVVETSTDLDRHQHGELTGARGRVREVLMGCGDTPWLFAQTLIPEATLAACPWLLELGSRPLGDALFARDDVERGAFLFARLEDGAPLAERVREVVAAARAPLWARRSYFYVGGRPLLVNEVFLPGLATVAER